MIHQYQLGRSTVFTLLYAVIGAACLAGLLIPAEAQGWVRVKQIDPRMSGNNLVSDWTIHENKTQDDIITELENQYGNLNVVGHQQHDGVNVSASSARYIWDIYPYPFSAGSEGGIRVKKLDTSVSAGTNYTTNWRELEGWSVSDWIQELRGQYGRGNINVVNHNRHDGVNVSADGTPYIWDVMPIPSSAGCGDGIVNQSSEECDGNDLDGATCTSQGYSGGSLSCTSSCTYDTSACTAGTANPDGSISVNRTGIAVGESVTVSWSNVTLTNDPWIGVYDSPDANNGAYTDWWWVNASNSSRSYSFDSAGEYTFRLFGSDGSFGFGAYSQLLGDVGAITVSDAPTASLSITPGTITEGQSANLSWSSSNANSCQFVGGNSAEAGGNTSGSDSVTPSNDTTYTIECDGSGGSVQASTDVTVESVNVSASDFSITVRCGETRSFDINEYVSIPSGVPINLTPLDIPADAGNIVQSGNTVEITNPSNDCRTGSVEIPYTVE